MMRWALLLGFGTLLNSAWLQNFTDIEGSGDDVEYPDSYDENGLGRTDIWSARRAGTQRPMIKAGIMKQIRTEVRDMKNILPTLANNISFMELDVRDMNRNFYAMAGDVRFIKNEVMYIKRQAHVIWENITDTRRDHKRMNKTLWWILKNVTILVEQVDKSTQQITDIANELNEAVNSVTDVTGLSNNVREMSMQFNEIKTSLDYNTKQVSKELNMVRDIVSHLSQATVDMRESMVAGFSQVDYYVHAAQNQILNNVTDVNYKVISIGNNFMGFSDRINEVWELLLHLGGNMEQVTANMIKVESQISEFTGNVGQISDKIADVSYKVGDVGRHLGEMDQYIGSLGTQFIDFLGTVNENFAQVHTHLGDVHDNIISNVSDVKGDLDAMKVQLRDMRQVIAEKCEGSCKIFQPNGGHVPPDSERPNWPTWVDEQIPVSTPHAGIHLTGRPPDYPSNGIPSTSQKPSYPTNGIGTDNVGGFPATTTLPDQYPTTDHPHPYPTTAPHYPYPSSSTYPSTTIPGYPPQYPPTLMPPRPPDFPSNGQSPMTQKPGYPSNIGNGENAEPQHPTTTYPYPHPTIATLTPGYPPVHPPTATPEHPPGYPPTSTHPYPSTTYPYPHLPTSTYASTAMPGYPYPTAAYPSYPTVKPPVPPYPPTTAIPLHPSYPPEYPQPAYPTAYPQIPVAPTENGLPQPIALPQGPEGPGLQIGCGNEFTGHCTCICPCECTCPVFNPTKSTLKQTAFDRFAYPRKQCQCLCSCPCQAPLGIDSTPSVPTFYPPSDHYVPIFEPPPTPSTPRWPPSPIIPIEPVWPPADPPDSSTSDYEVPDAKLECCDDIKELISEEVTWMVDTIEYDMERKFAVFKEDIYEFFDGVIRFHIDVSDLVNHVKAQIAVAVAGAVSAFNELTASMSQLQRQWGIGDTNYPTMRPPQRPGIHRPGNPPEFAPPGQIGSYIPNRPQGRPQNRPQLPPPQFPPNRPPPQFPPSQPPPQFPPNRPPPQFPPSQPSPQFPPNRPPSQYPPPPSGRPPGAHPASPTTRPLERPPGSPPEKPQRPTRPQRPGRPTKPQQSPQGSIRPKSTNRRLGSSKQPAQYHMKQSQNLRNETITPTTEVSVSTVVARRSFPVTDKTEHSTMSSTTSSRRNKKKKKKRKKAQGCVNERKTLKDELQSSGLKRTEEKVSAVSDVDEETDNEDDGDLKDEGNSNEVEVSIEQKEEPGTELAIPDRDSGIINRPMNPIEFHNMLQKQINDQIMEAVKPDRSNRKKGKRLLFNRWRNRGRKRNRKRSRLPIMAKFPFVRPPIRLNHPIRIPIPQIPMPNLLDIRPPPNLFESLPPDMMVGGINGSPYSFSYNDGRGNSWNVNVNRRNNQEALGIKTGDWKSSDDELEQKKDDAHEETGETDEELSNGDEGNERDETTKHH